MADQSLGNNAADTALSILSRVVPKSIDADSAQRTLLMPPTGRR